MREGFRNFRLDRMSDVETTAETYTPQSGRTLRDFFRHYEEEGQKQRER
jgi:predicted DNA-binding transcriptional regulator YafY